MGNAQHHKSRHSRDMSDQDSRMSYHHMDNIVTKIHAKIEKKPTTIDETSPVVLKYKTPHFRACATVQFPAIPNDEEWQIGWIQACTHMDFIIRYGDLGYSSWFFPELKSGQHSMISDSDGKNYPWYGSRTEVATVKGPCPTGIVRINMNDNFYPHITWAVPVGNSKTPQLSHIRRDQSFYTWLVAHNVTTGSYYILKTIFWRVILEIVVDPTKPRGQRSMLVGNGIQEQPKILPHNIDIPRNAFNPPNANSAQTLVWYPTIGPTVVIVPPKIIPAQNMDSEESLV